MITTTHSHKHWTDEGGHVTIRWGTKNLVKENAVLCLGSL